MADSVVSLGLDLSAFEATLRAGFDGLDKRSVKALAEAKRAASEAIRETARATTAAIRSQDDAARAARASAAQAAREAEAAARAQADALREQQREEARLAAEAERRAAAQAQAGRALAGLAAQTSEAERLTHAYEEQIREIRRLVSITGDHAAGEKAAAAAAAKHARELDRVEREARGEADALREAERAAKDAAKAAADASRQQREGLKGLGELVGLPVDQIEKFGQAVGLVGGPLAAMAGGAAIAAASVGLAAAATVGLVRAAIDLEAEVAPLRRDGLLPPLPDGYAAQLDEADLAMRGAVTAAKALTAQVGAALAPAVEYGAVVLGDLVTSVMASGDTLRGFGQVIRSGVIVWLQTLIDYALRIPTLYARMAGAVGSALSALGATDIGGQLQSVSADLIDFKNSIGTAVVDGVITDWTTGVALMGRSADVSGAAIKRLGAAQRSLDDRPPAAAKGDAAAEAKKAEEAAKRAAEATAQWAREQGMVAAAAQDLARLAPELEALVALLEQAAAVELAKTFSDLDASVADTSDAIKAGLLSPLSAAATAAKGLGQSLSSAAGIDLSGGLTTAIIGAARDSVEAEQAALASIAEARAGLREAVASGDVEAIAGARAALATARSELQAARPEAFVTGLIEGAADMVQGIVDALPAVVDGLVASAPALIDGIIGAIPDLVVALAEASPQIAIDLATALAIQLPIQLLAAAPQIAVSLARGIAGGFVEAAGRIRQVIGDIFREISTGGRADTRTFGDTPGVQRVGPGGARVSSGDYVVAARSREGLQAQLGGSPQAAPVVVTLDVRDGPVQLGISRAVSREQRRQGAGRDTTGRRSPYSGAAAAWGV